MYILQKQQNRRKPLHQMLLSSKDRHTQQYLSKILCHIHLTSRNSLHLFVKYLHIYLRHFYLIITTNIDNQNWLNEIKYTIPNTPIFTNIKNIIHTLKVILNEAENRGKYTVITVNSDCNNSVNQSLMLLRCVLRCEHQDGWNNYDLIESGISFNLNVKSRIMSVPLIKKLIKLEDIDIQDIDIRSIVDKIGKRIIVYDTLCYYMPPRANIYHLDLQYQTVGLYYSSSVLAMRLIHHVQENINKDLGLDLLPLPQEKNIKTPGIAFTSGGLGDVIAMDRIRGLDGIKKIYIATPKKRALLVRDYLKAVYPSIEIEICNNSEKIYHNRWDYIRDANTNNIQVCKSVINEISGSCIDFNISYLQHSQCYYMITNGWNIISWGTSVNLVSKLVPIEYIQKMENKDFSLVKSRQFKPVKNNILPRIQEKINESIVKTKSRGIAIVVVSTNDTNLCCTICNKVHNDDSKCLVTRNMNISEMNSVYAFLENNNLVGVVWSCKETILHKKDRWVDISKEAKVVDYMALINNAKAYVGIDSWISCYAAWSMANEMNRIVIIKSINQNALQNCQFYWGIDIGTSSSNVTLMKSFENVATIRIG